jgi:hypothetical protein
VTGKKEVKMDFGEVMKRQSELIRRNTISVIAKLDAHLQRRSEKLAEIKVGVKRARDNDTVAQDLKVSAQPEMKRKKVDSVEIEKKDEAKDDSNPEDTKQANTVAIQGQKETVKGMPVPSVAE